MATYCKAFIGHEEVGVGVCTGCVLVAAYCALFLLIMLWCVCHQCQCHASAPMHQDRGEVCVEVCNCGWVGAIGPQLASVAEHLSQ